MFTIFQFAKLVKKTLLVTSFRNELDCIKSNFIVLVMLTRVHNKLFYLDSKTWFSIFELKPWLALLFKALAYFKLLSHLNKLFNI